VVIGYDHGEKRCRHLTECRVNFCYECPDIPCERLKTIDKRYRERYRMSMPGNLAFIKDYGIEAFLKKRGGEMAVP
jgi:hypothetical protein